MVGTKHISVQTRNRLLIYKKLISGIDNLLIQTGSYVLRVIDWLEGHT